MDGAPYRVTQTFREVGDRYVEETGVETDNVSGAWKSSQNSMLICVNDRGDVGATAFGAMVKEFDTFRNILHCFKDIFVQKLSALININCGKPMSQPERWRLRTYE